MIKKFQAACTNPLKRFGISTSNQINAAWSVLDAFSSPVFSLLLIPILTHYIGLEEYGSYVLAMALVAMLNFTGLGMNLSLTYHLASNHATQTKTQIKDRIATALCITFISSSLFASIGMIANITFNDWIARQYHLLTRNQFTIPIALATSIFVQCDTVIAAAFKGMQQFKSSSQLEFSLRLANFLAIFATAAISKNVFDVILCVFINNTINLCSRYLFFNKLHDTPFNISNLKKKSAIELINFGKWVTIQNIAGALYGSLDKMLVGGVLGSKIVGLYNILLTITQLIQVILATSLGFIFSKVSVNKKAITSKMLQLGVLFSLISSTVIAFIILSFKNLIYRKFNISDEYDFIFYGLIISHVILALNVPFYYVGLSVNLLKSLSFLILIGSVIGLLSLATFITIIGIKSVVISKLLYSVITLFIALPVIKYIKKID